MKTKLKPCDCKDMFSARQLNEQGIIINDDSIMVEPSVVVLTMGHTKIRIPMEKFKIFSEWYLKGQEIENYKGTKYKNLDTRDRS